MPTYLLPAAPAFSLIIGYYLQIVLDQSGAVSSRIARFWSARAATITTCVAALGFLGFVFSSEAQISMPTFGWALVWTMLLMVSLLLVREDRSPRSAWASSTVAAGLLGLMVMHQLVPAYSRSQTLLGEGSPLGPQIASSRHIATITHEFSEVPYYLNRSDIAHWTHVGSAGLKNFVQDHEETILVVANHVPVRQLRSQLPEGATATVIAELGPATFLRVVSQPRVARVDSGTRDDRTPKNR